MDDNWVKTTVGDRTFNAFHETQWTIESFFFIFFFVEEDFDENRVCDIAVVYIVDDGVVVAKSYKARLQSNLRWATLSQVYSLAKNLKPSHSNLKNPIVMRINFIEIKFTMHYTYLLICQKKIWVEIDVREDKSVCGLQGCKEKQRGLESVWRLLSASEYCRKTVFCRWVAVETAIPLWEY